MTRSFGGFKLTSVENLPNIQVAFPGEHWSDGKASEDITPGQLVVPSSSAGKRTWAPASSGTVDPRACLALNCVQPPDSNQGSIYAEGLGPNQIVNRTIETGTYVHAYRSGAFILTLFAEDTYEPADLLEWDPDAVAQTGKPADVGAWVKSTTPANALFEVIEFRVLPGETDRGVLTVKSLRSQF